MYTTFIYISMYFYIMLYVYYVYIYIDVLPYHIFKHQSHLVWITTTTCIKQCYSPYIVLIVLLQFSIDVVEVSGDDNCIQGIDSSTEICQTACYNTGLSFIMVISEAPWSSHLLPSGWQWSTTCFNDLGLSRPGIELQSPARTRGDRPVFLTLYVFSLACYNSSFVTLSYSF